MKSFIPSELTLLANTQLTRQILPFWMKAILKNNDGLVGEISADGLVNSASKKSAILNARILWSFSAAYEHTLNPDWLNIAKYSYIGFSSQLLDSKFGGVLCHAHTDETENKPLLAQTYALYALSQYYRITGDAQALSDAHCLWQVIERYYRRSEGFYLSECRHDLKPIEPENNAFDMTCTLHVLEALTQYYLISPSLALRDRLTELTDFFLNKIFTHYNSFPLRLNQKGKLMTKAESVGHLLEALFLVSLACIALQDDTRLYKTTTHLRFFLEITLQEKRHPSGNVFTGKDENGQSMPTFSWWPQAELNNAVLMALHNGSAIWLEFLENTWQVITRDWVDQEFGEWHSELDFNSNTLKQPKAGERRCPYHTTRACLALAFGVNSLASPIPMHNEAELPHTLQ